MGNTSEISPLRDREIFYYRQRNKNRVFEKIAMLFVEEAERRGVTKKQIAELLKKDTGLITRWLSGPNNLTLDTISDLLLALGAEMDYEPVRFADRQKGNYFHPLMGQCKPVVHVSTSSAAVTDTIAPVKSGLVVNVKTASEMALT
jgi:hypothetical protein